MEARKLDERYMKGGLRGSELRELERSRDEMRHRDWWLKKMARPVPDRLNGGEDIPVVRNSPVKRLA